MAQILRHFISFVHRWLQFLTQNLKYLLIFFFENRVEFVFLNSIFLTIERCTRMNETHANFYCDLEISVLNRK